ncbi:MAG: hypothetical protein EHM35_00370 [Planctomycetaceae bacterium]|nr:MAG: hypothetical protein EHM35_00370 [Planctomycetaceae bacterium]
MTTAQIDPKQNVLNELAGLVRLGVQAKARALADIAAELAPAWGCDPNACYLDSAKCGAIYRPVLRSPGNEHSAVLQQRANGYTVLA